MQDTSTPTAVPDRDHPLGPGFGPALGNMRFIGWVSLIYGVLACLTLVGALIGVPLIIAAHRFLEGVGRFEVYRRDPADLTELRTGFDELGRSFAIVKVLVIIHVVLAIGYIGFLFLVGGVGILGGLAEA